MTQSPLTVIARIKPGELNALDTILQEIAADPAHNNCFPFGKLQVVHFARFVIIQNVASNPGKSLYFESVFDGTLDDHLQEIVEEIGPGIEAVWGKCEDFPTALAQNAAAFPAAFKKFIHTHSLNPIVYYSAYPKETVRMVHLDTRIHQALETFLDQKPVARLLDLLGDVWS
jgi:hypothetical protein